MVGGRYVRIERKRNCYEVYENICVRGRRVEGTSITTLGRATKLAADEEETRVVAEG